MMMKNYTTPVRRAAGSKENGMGEQRTDKGSIIEKAGILGMNLREARGDREKEDRILEQIKNYKSGLDAEGKKLFQREYNETIRKGIEPGV